MGTKSLMHRCIIGFIINHIAKSAIKVLTISAIKVRLIVRKALNFVNHDNQESLRKYLRRIFENE